MNKPLKSFIRIMIPSCVALVALGVGLLPRLDELKFRAIPGEIVFKNPKPLKATYALAPSKSSTTKKGPIKWFNEQLENLLASSHNPWKRSPELFDEHFQHLSGSKSPLDQSKCAELWRLADAKCQQLLSRYPEMAVTYRIVPDEQNGFLKWLDFADRRKNEGTNEIVFPKDLGDFLAEEGAWNQQSAIAWVTEHKQMLDELRAIGLMTEQSVRGIPIKRWQVIALKFLRRASESLMIEARLAAEQGDVEAALIATRAAHGLADHIGKIETPSLHASVVQALAQMKLKRLVLHEILPTLPPSNINLAEWETLLNLNAQTPADFVMSIKGQWHVLMRFMLLPILMDGENPHALPDAGEFLDAYTMDHIEHVRVYEGRRLTDLPTLTLPPSADTSQLSRESRRAYDLCNIHSSWLNNWISFQSMTAMTHAAFAIMKGQPIPRDPIYGLEYRWDPETRELSMPNGKAFIGITPTPITVPKLESLDAPD